MKSSTIERDSTNEQVRICSKVHCPRNILLKSNLTRMHLSFKYYFLRPYLILTFLQAQKEFDNFKNTLQNSGIKVMEFVRNESKAPDAIFPDWFTTHKNEDIPEGVFILYPMKHPSRQLERDQQIIEELSKNYKHFIDLSTWEKDGLALEGKGSLVYDYRNQKIYCALSPRACKAVIDDLIV